MLNTFPSKHYGMTSQDWLLLDNQSTVDWIANSSCFTKIHTIHSKVQEFCNAGSIIKNKCAKFGSLNIWYNLKIIANIISFKTIKSQYHLMYDHENRGEVFLEGSLNLSHTKDCIT